MVKKDGSFFVKNKREIKINPSPTNQQTRDKIFIKRKRIHPLKHESIFSMMNIFHKRVFLFFTLHKKGI